MFTGIVTHLGTVREIRGSSERELSIEPGFALDDLAVGASVAHSGVCLTVTEKLENCYRVAVSGESLRCTTIGSWEAGRRINLERSLRLGDELGGHLVFGHVDGLGAINAIEQEGDSHRVEIGVPSALAPMIAVKGSISVDGISLTITEARDDGFAVAVIPHSWGHTTLCDRKAGDLVNLEVDMLARYVARQLAFAGRG